MLSIWTDLTKNGLDDNFASSKPKTCTEELEIIYSVALLVEDMSIHMEKYYMVYVFSILKFSAYGTPEYILTKISWIIIKRINWPK